MKYFEDRKVMAYIGHVAKNSKRRWGYPVAKHKSYPYLNC
jgi:hypothetical protein